MTTDDFHDPLVTRGDLHWYAQRIVDFLSIARAGHRTVSPQGPWANGAVAIHNSQILGELDGLWHLASRWGDCHYRELTSAHVVISSLIRRWGLDGAVPGSQPDREAGPYLLEQDEIAGLETAVSAIEVALTSRSYERPELADGVRRARTIRIDTPERSVVVDGAVFVLTKPAHFKVLQMFKRLVENKGEPITADDLRCAKPRPTIERHCPQLALYVGTMKGQGGGVYVLPPLESPLIR